MLQQWTFLFPLELMFCLFHLGIPHKARDNTPVCPNTKIKRQTGFFGKSEVTCERGIASEFTGMLAVMPSGPFLILLTLL